MDGSKKFKVIEMDKSMKSNQIDAQRSSNIGVGAGKQTNLKSIHSSFSSPMGQPNKSQKNALGISVQRDSSILKINNFEKAVNQGVNVSNFKKSL